MRRSDKRLMQTLTGTFMLVEVSTLHCSVPWHKLARARTSAARLALSPLIFLRHEYLSVSRTSCKMDGPNNDCDIQALRAKTTVVCDPRLSFLIRQGPRSLGGMSSGAAHRMHDIA